jgi:hypothetical protein
MLNTILNANCVFTWPQCSSFADNKTDMMGAFLHLASEVYGSADHQIWIRPTDFDLGVESTNVELGSCHGLLTHTKSLSKSSDFWMRKWFSRKSLKLQI